MALILAIEPDRRQAAQLARVIQNRVGAELVLADTTEQALGAIGNRVPDLVLVPALLAPQDDATLATALRVIAAAAHVQMLTIPMLAPARGAAEPLGMLARLRRRRTDPVPPDGCDPDVFGDQIAAYLAEAAAQRAIIESDLAIERSTKTTHSAHDTTDAPGFSQDSPALSVHVVLGAGQSIEEPSAGEPPIAAVETFMVAELVIERATVELDLEAALFITTKDTKDTQELEPYSPDLGAHGVLVREGSLEEQTADESPIAADERFMLAEPAVEVAIEQPTVSATLVAFTTKDTKDTQEISLDGPDLCVPDVLDGNVAIIENVELEMLVASITKDTKDTSEDATVEDLPLAAAIDLAATSEEVSAHLDGPKRIAVSEAPWFGPQRRWPDLEGEAAVDRLTVFAVEETADADVHVHAASVPVAAASLIEELPAILAALDESAAVVIEEAPVVVQDALPAIDTVPFTAPAPAAVLELWMPLSFGSTRAWPTLEGVWSEARPDPPAPVHVDPAALAHADPPALVLPDSPALVLADPPAPVHVDPPALVYADSPAVAAPPPTPSPAAERVPPPDAIAARPEWIELIESLRQDVKRLRTERAQAPAAAPRIKPIPMPVLRPSPAVRLAVGADEELTPTKRAKSAKPAQDEWGFFDPEQCGFAALLAKLDEITHVPDGV